MKKLFATLLAATMVAGTAVSAFAYIPVNMADKAASNDAYTLEKKGKAYKDNGDPYPRMVEGGDKIYYPILVAGDEIDDKNGKADEYYYATKASEVEDLKVTLKDVRGGKYIKGAKIVRQDLKFANVFEGAYADHTATLADLNKAVAGKGVTVVKGELTGGKTTNNTLEKADVEVTEDWTVGKVAGKAADKAEDVKIEATINGTEITLKGNSGFKTNAEDKEYNYEAIKDAIDVALSAKKDEFTVVVPSTAALAVDDKGAVKEADTKLDGIKITRKIDAKVKYVQNTTALNDAKKEVDGKVEAKVTTSNGLDTKGSVEFTVTGDIVNTSKDGKIYCVEVELGDYFGTQETEVEFDLTLRTRSKQYETKDDGYAPRTSFDLGKDAVEAPELKDGARLFENGNDYTSVKFRNNELTLGINKYTRSVKLDEAKKANNDVEDIERIFLEGDDFNFEVKASDQDELYLEYNQDANKKVILANPDAKMDFFNFPGKPEFDFTGLAQFDVEDPDKSYYFYEIVDDKPVKTTAKYNKEDECFELRTRTLGSYVISDKELKAAENPADKDADKPATDKPTTETPVNPTTPGKNVPTGALA